MKGYTNPFHTFEDVVATLESLATNPLCKDEINPNWASDILGISVDKNYDEECNFYYVTTIHINVKGMKEFVRTVEGAYVIGREHYDATSPYDRIELELSDTLTVVALIPSDEEFTWEENK